MVAAVLGVATQGVPISEDRLRERFFVRRPVLDARQGAVGYALELARPLAGSGADPVLRAMDDEKLLIGVVSLQVDGLLEGKTVFVAVTPENLGGSVVAQMPLAQTVFCVSADDLGTAVLAAGGEKGLRLAADASGDAVLDPGQLRMAEIVRVDVSKADVSAMRKEMIEIQLGRDIVFLARHVEHDDMFEACNRLGFALFEGRFFTRIQANKPHRLDVGRLRVVELLDLAAREAPIADIERRFKDDPALSYRLLRYINSPAVGLRHTVKSIAHAITLLGYKPLYRWLTLLLYSAGRPAPRDAALLSHALIRARFMETLAAPVVGRAEAEGIFITGIFSLLDALLNAPMVEILHRVNLPAPVTEALLADTGPYAAWLALARACEDGDIDALAAGSENLGLTVAAVNQAHLAAVSYAHSVQR